MTTPNNNYSSLVWYFSILVILAIACRILSDVIFAKLSQNTIAKMREIISERIACASFRQIEVLGGRAARTKP
ncbi:hypothetical protein [Photorhabdus stackebrandtii]|uniref:hypothetical protein n=1 Tax=Photorhabdus stackebrandtii TaxID=1123042 RepID=UPI00140C78F5|nr:hypothetical protein [Photorhabdus stackebrandtii]